MCGRFRRQRASCADAPPLRPKPWVTVQSGSDSTRSVPEADGRARRLSCKVLIDIHHTSQRNIGDFGPSRSSLDGTSCARKLTPCCTFRLRLSRIIHKPKPALSKAPVPPAAAESESAGTYLGSSWLRKMFELTTPMRFDSGSPTLVSMTLLFSSAMF